MAQQPRIPNIEAQRAAMKKLEFMVGKWAGEARLLRGPGDPVSLIETEEAQYKLDGLILAVPHRVLGGTDWNPLFAALAPGGVLVDVKSVIAHEAVPPGLHYWSL